MLAGKPYNGALDHATDRRVVDAYLARRGLSASSPILRGDAHCPYFDGERRMLGRYPAVIAPVHGPEGSLESAQRIYNADVDPRKKLLPGRYGERRRGPPVRPR